MLTVCHIESAVIMFGIVGAIPPGSAVVPGKLHSVLLLSNFFLKSRAALLPNLPVFASDNTQYEPTQASTLLGGAAALDPPKAPRIRRMAPARCQRCFAMPSFISSVHFAYLLIIRKCFLYNDPVRCSI